jgi:hypothetical protein
MKYSRELIHIYIRMGVTMVTQRNEQQVTFIAESMHLIVAASYWTALP